MTSGPAATRAPRERPRRGVRIIAVVTVLAVVVGGTVAAIVAATSARDRGLLGGPVVVPVELRPVLRQAAKRCKEVPLEVLAAQIAAESAWDPRAVSPAGARGIAQFMPAVWDQYGIDADGDGIADIENPVDAIHSAAALNCVNRKLVRGISGNRLRNTLAAYNAGYGAVRQYDGIPPYPETQAYVAKVLESARTIVLH